MAMQHIDTAPEPNSFTPLREHEQQTPTTFFGAKPVLYAHYSGLTLSAPAGQLDQDATFAKFSSEQEGDNSLVNNVDIWVNSE